ncbi:MAG: DUF1376 domain-containing protein [Holophagales bacterium]|nr:MAG: DUF1376 domain-containing protein [Holophagales bacterium]
MSRRLPYLRIFVSDELVLGQGLTAQEFGARMRLLFRAWMNEGKLPNDPKRLAAWAGVNGGRWNEISETVLADHFKLAGHELIASNLVQQLDDDSARIEASRRGGKRSAELRGSALEAPSALTSSAPEVRFNPQRTTFQHNANAAQSDQSAPASPSADLALYVSAMRESWPRWQDELALERELFKLQSLLPPLAEFRRIVADAVRQAGDGWREQNAKFCPSPAKWIANGRWRDRAPSQMRKPRERTAADARLEILHTMGEALNDGRIDQARFDAGLEEVNKATTAPEVMRIGMPYCQPDIADAA